MHQSAVVTQFTIFCAVELLRLVTSGDKMTSLLKSYKLLCSVSKLSTKSVGSRRELVANKIVFTPSTPTRRTVIDVTTIYFHYY